MEFTKETGIQYVKNVLERNGFEEILDGRLKKDDCYIKINEDHYEVMHYEEMFLEWVSWFSNDLSVYGLIGYLSWYNFIERGYKK